MTTWLSDANGKRISGEYEKTFVISTLGEILTDLIVGHDPELEVRSMIRVQRGQVSEIEAVAS